MLHRIFFVFLVIISVNDNILYAQTLDPQQDIIQRQREWQELQEQKFEEKWQDKAVIPQDEKIIVVPDEGKCFYFNIISLKGGTIIKEKEYKEIILPRLNTCMNLSAIDELMNLISSYYINKGYVTARVYIPSQDIEDGSLEIFISEGKLESLNIKKNGKTAKFKNAFDLAEDENLNIHKLEQGLDQINRLRGRSAILQMSPGEKQGGTAVIVEDNYKKKWFMDGVFDNYGSTATSRNSYQAALTLADLVGLYEYWDINYKHDATGDIGKGIENLAVNFAIPYGSWTYKLAASYFEYKNFIGNLNGTVQARGTEKYYKGEVEKVLNYNSQGKLSAYANLYLRDNDNYVANVRTEINSRKLSGIQIGINYLGKLADSVIQTRLSYERGLKLFGALDDSESRLDEKAQYNLFQLKSSLSKRFTVRSAQTAYNGTLFVQYSPDRLFGTEQMNLASSYSVRGFQDQNYSAVNGAFLRQELAFDWGVSAYNPVPYIALDIGTAFAGPVPDSEFDRAVGAAVGLKFISEYGFFDLSLEKSLLEPTGVEAESNIIRFKVGISF